MSLRSIEDCDDEDGARGSYPQKNVARKKHGDVENGAPFESLDQVHDLAKAVLSNSIFLRGIMEDGHVNQKSPHGMMRRQTQYLAATIATHSYTELQSNFNAYDQ